MSFFAQMFSSSATASYGRFASFLALVCLLIWVSLLITQTKTIPEIPTSWLAIIMLPFTISKVGDAIAGKSDATTDPATK